MCIRDRSSPVHKIRYSSTQVQFITKQGHTYQAKYGIITGTPVALNTHITWDPPLPPGTALMLGSARIGNYNKHYAFFTQGAELWRQNSTLWNLLSNTPIEWPMVYASLPPRPPDAQQMPNGTDFFGSGVVDNSPVTRLDPTDSKCPNGVGALFSFGWPQNGSTAAERAQGWYPLLAGVEGLPRPSSVIGQAWAEEEYVMGAYGAWWPPGVLTSAAGDWDHVPGGRVFFAGSEWSEVGSGYMNGAIHNGRKHGTMVADLLRSEQRVSN
eukprot:TRINITY_DN59784_c0_g1_i5.p1 TRINITY_DN59784_c0_g1~~TRINITY_DN59784_c0_g1_i5.p1  ORF type:complete len:268 (+),score=41.05 TRINITY_DN59784_c0_g1_i5:146-949(+)